MANELYFGGAAIAGGGVVLLVLAWLIGVGGKLDLISNYRAHPERYPDGPGLGRWMGVTLAIGGLSFVTGGFAVMAGAVREEISLWAIATATVLVVGAFAGLARYRRVPPPASPGAGSRRVPRTPARR